MENQDPSPTSTGTRVSIWVAPSLRDLWPAGAFASIDDEVTSSWRVEDGSQEISLFANRRLEFKLPLTTSNIKFFADYISLNAQHSLTQGSRTDTAIQELANLASPLFFGAGTVVDIRPFMDKIANTISLKNGLDGLFNLKWFQNHSPGILLVHQKGEARAWQIGSGHEDSGVTRTIDIEHFNQLFSSVKKTKTGQYTTQTKKWDWLPFSGAFLAESFSFKGFNAILIATRQEFLSFATEEVTHFHSFAGLLGLWLEDLIEGEFSDLRLAEVMLLLERSPLPIVLRDARDLPVFTNQAFQQNEPAMVRWLALGRGFHLGVGRVEEWENTQFDVLHRHKISLLGDLFNTLGHELSNPLFGLGLAADLLISNSDDEDSSMMLVEIQKNIKRCQLIIQNLTRLYADQEQEGVCDLRMVIREALTLAKSELKGIRHDTGTVLQESTPLMVEGRPVLIVQVLFNLIVNSAQALSGQGSSSQIWLRAEVESGQVHVDVIDNGPGLPASVKESLFRPFATTKAKGHGLGLALSRNLALKAGGDLTALSPPSGAAFRLTLRRVPS